MPSQNSTRLRSPGLLSHKAQLKLERRTSGIPGQLIRYFLTTYPGIVVTCVAALIAGGFIESIGVAALLPVLGKLTGSDVKLPPPLDRWFDALFTFLGVEPTLNMLLTLVITLLVAKIVIGFLVAAFISGIQARLTGEFRSAVIESLGNARWSYFARQASGRAVNALLSETAKAANGLTGTCQLLASVVQVVIFAGMASLISWKATAIGLCASLLGTILLSGLVRLLRENQRERIITTSNMTARLVDGLSNMKTLKAMGVERRMTKLIARDIASIRRNAYFAIVLNEGINALQELIKLLALLVAFFFLFAMGGEPLELILVVLLLFLRVMQSANAIQNKYKGLVSCEAPFEHVQGLIEDAKAEEEPIKGHEVPSLADSLRLENVSFAYEEERILNGINLAIPAGNLVCLAGPSGSGKTTLMDLVCGLVQPQEGEVIVDGVPLSEINLRRWRRRIGYVPQELILFHDTLFANVTLGDDRIPVADVEQALRAAEAWDFIERLPEGLETVVGERGIRFSGGQRQRISIARALVRRPLLLVLDEATANLDPATESELCKTFARLRGQVTILAATHQPALTLVADAVYRVHKGCLEAVNARAVSAATRTQLTLAMQRTRCRRHRSRPWPWA